ncbi:MAG: helix-turn-helix domain-containing protein [Actinomycetota bacterium]
MSSQATVQHRAAFGAAAVTFLLCVGVSLWANMATAEPFGAARAVQGWPVLAVVIAEVLVLWIPGQGWEARARQILAAGLGVLALAMSYRHMRSQALDVGLVGWEADAWPLTVDGLLVLAGLALHELWPSVSGRRAERRVRSKPRSVKAKPAELSVVAGGGGSAPSASVAGEPGKGRKKVDDVAVLAARAERPDVSTKELAERFGVTERTIRRVFERAANGAAGGDSTSAGGDQ